MTIKVVSIFDKRHHPIKKFSINGTVSEKALENLVVNLFISNIFATFSYTKRKKMRIAL